MLNNINLEGLDAARKAISADRTQGVAKYGLQMTWEDGVRMKAETTAMSLGDQQIERNHAWVIDEPPELLGGSAGPTPQEYLMSGVGACIMVGFVVNASVRGIELHSLKLKMSGSLDLAGFMNLTEDAQVKMAGIDYEIEVGCDAEETLLEEVAKAAVEFSPNAMTVQNGVPVNGTLKIVA